MGFKGTVINQVAGDVGGEPINKRRVMALIAGVPSGSVGNKDAELDTPYRIIGTKQAENLGIDDSFDSNNSVLVYDDIKECFRLSPQAEVILMLTEQPDGTSGNELVDWFKNGGAMDTLLGSDTAKDVKYIFTRWNPDSSYSPAYSYTDGGNTIDTYLAYDVLKAIPQAQLKVDEYYSQFRYIDGVMLDGWQIDSGSYAMLENLREEASQNISVIISQDGYVLDDVFDSTNNALTDMVSVGAAMGMFGVRQINENLGSVEVLNPPPNARGQENYPLDNGIRWPYVQLADGTRIGDLSFKEQKDLTDKGYIYAGSFAGYPGLYFSGDPTCTEITSSYAFINNNCVFNAAARLVREGTIPKVRSVLKKNPDTGNITVTSAASIEQFAQQKLNLLLREDLVSDVSVTIDPAQSPGPNTPLKASVRVVKDDIIHQFEVDLGLFNTA